MAIEPVKHLTLLAPRRSAEELTGWLQQLSVVHVRDAGSLVGDDDEEAEGFERPAAPSEEVDRHVRRLSRINDIFGEFDALESSFIQMIVALPARVTREKREKVLANFDYEPVYKEACRFEEAYRDHQAAIESAREEYKRLEFFRLLPFEPGDVHALTRTRVWVGSIMEQQWEQLRTLEKADELLAMTELRRDKRMVDICAVSLREDEEEASRLLRSYQFEELAVPQYEADTRVERMDALTEEITSRHREAERCREGVKDLAGDAEKVGILLGYWEAERAKISAQNNMLSSNRISVLTGFIRERDVDSFKTKLSEDFPSVSDIYRKPVPEDEVPVAITNSRLLKPLRFLVDLFGRPDYFGFDPTPYLAFSFLIFFALCFGDVVYGFGLALTGYLLARKARPYEGLHNLCMLFCYAGVFTMIVGVFMGSWASDLWSPEYLGEGNLLYRIRQSTALVDPIDRAVLLLVVSIGIGVVNQFYGIILKAYALIRKGRVWDAVFDAGLWFLVLPGFLIAFSSLFFDIPPVLLRLGFGLMIVGGVGLIMTQGREADSIAGKFGAGLISIYGIMGSYGCVTFLSDILSYSRLLALGLTTEIVGMAFNIIAGLVRESPVAGAVLFVAVLLVGHTFNFMVSMLAAFVHPARLIFLEFFNRFYEAGGEKFSPLSLSTESMLVEE